MDELHVKLLPGEAELEISFFDLDGKVRFGRLVYSWVCMALRRYSESH